MIAAAESRAEGNCWPAVARDAQTTVATIRRWIRAHPQQWRRLLARARKECRRSAADEAITTLRRHLRGEDEKTQYNAAKQLTSTEPRDRSRSSPRPTASPELTREEIEAIARELAAADDAPPEGDPLG